MSEHHAKFMTTLRGESVEAELRATIDRTSDDTQASVNVTVSFRKDGEPYQVDGLTRAEMTQLAREAAIKARETAIDDLAAKAPITNEAAYCPHCGHLVDSATSVTGRRQMPVEGDYSACFYCANVLVFRADLTLREPTRAEFDDAPPQLMRLVTVLKARLLEKDE